MQNEFLIRKNPCDEFSKNVIYAIMKILYFVSPDNLSKQEDEIINDLYKRGLSDQNFVTPEAQEFKPNIQPSINNASFIKENTALDITKKILPFAMAGIPGIIMLGGALAYERMQKSAAEKDELNKQTAEEISKFIQEYAITERIAKFLGYRFQPGHPRINKAYILHPLGSHKIEEYRNLFIPYETYDEVLYDEREAELVKLLVDLGATKISIEEINATSEKTSASLNCEVGTEAGSGSFGIDGGKTVNQSTDCGRQFILKGKKLVFPFDRKKYNWLDFEPSWASIVMARCEGECLKAEMFLKEKTSYSIELKSSAGLKMAIASGKVDAKLSGFLSDDKGYKVSAEFLPF